MGKTCGFMLGVGLAGAVAGLHFYMLMEPKDQKRIKRELNETLEDLKKASKKLAELG